MQHIFEEIPSSLIDEAIKGVPESESMDLRDKLKSIFEGRFTEVITANKLEEMELELAELHHCSSNKLGLVGHISAESFEAIVGQEPSDVCDTVQSGLVLALALRRFRMLLGLGVNIGIEQDD